MSESEKSQREGQLRHWCEKQSVLAGRAFDWVMVSGDASFRRYFRLANIDGGNNSLVAVDAPPDKEDSRQFCKVAEIFSAQGCILPEVIATDFEKGFMLLGDLGDRQLLAELNEGNVEHYYGLAFGELIKLQSAESCTGLPPYDHEKLMQEMELFQEWFLDRYLGLSLEQGESELINGFQVFLSEQVQRQKQVYVHRDFHSRNLMIVGNSDKENLALIDFQDALIGPITYDAVSLLKDVYVEWPEAKRKQLLKVYFESLKENQVLEDRVEFESFFRDFELMGLQRHLKILGIFARLSIRDKKDGYLKDLPLTFKYVEEALKHLGEYELAKNFEIFFVQKLKPLFLEKQVLEKQVPESHTQERQSPL